MGAAGICCRLYDCRDNRGKGLGLFAFLWDLITGSRRQGAQLDADKGGFMTSHASAKAAAPPAPEAVRPYELTARTIRLIGFHCISAQPDGTVCNTVWHRPMSQAGDALKRGQLCPTCGSGERIICVDWLECRNVKTVVSDGTIRRVCDDTLFGGAGGG